MKHVLHFALFFGVAGALPTWATPLPFDHIFFIVLENTTYSEAMKQPFLTQLAQQGARLDGFQAESHPSQPNYVALTSGSTNGVTGDGNVNLNVNHIADLLEAKQLTWKVYAELFPGNCFTGATKGKYARKHVPFISYVNVQQNPSRCANIVEAGQLDADIANGSLPNYILYIPDLNNDGHDTGAAYADNWLSQTFGPRLKDPRFTKGLLLVVTFDENDGTADGNHILTIVYGAGVLAGSTSSDQLNHYSLLRLVEDNWALGNLGKSDLNAPVIQNIWQ